MCPIFPSFFPPPFLFLSRQKRGKSDGRGRSKEEAAKTLKLRVSPSSWTHSPDAHRGSYSYLFPWIQCYVSIYISQAVPWSATVYVNVATAYALRYGRVSPLSAQPSFRIYRVCRCLSNQPRGEQKESYERRIEHGRRDSIVRHRNATIFSTIMKITFEEIDGIFLLFLTTAATRYSANL